MDNRRNPRHEIPLSNLQTGRGRPHQERRPSSRMSDVDPVVADGFRPVSPLSRSPSPSPVEERAPPLRRSLSMPLENYAENRNSIAKRNGIGMALSEEQSHEDHGDSSEQYFDPNTSRFISRPSSSSSVSYDSATSPYRTRISRISFSYPRRPTTPSGPSIQPAHPYALYQQTTFEEPEEIEESSAQQIPIGFAGRQNRYRRTTGPDGEELEVMGPDGHMEQLPPYTRYPEAGPLPQKAAMVTSSPVSSLGDASAEASHNITPATPVTPASTVISPILPSAPATPQISNHIQDFGPLNRLQTNQTQQAISPQSPIAAPTHSSFASDTRAIQSSSSSLAEEKKRGSGGWNSIKRKRVLCGIVPLWVVILIIVLLLFASVIAGGVLGGLLTQRGEKKHRATNIPLPTLNAMWDAAPTAAPTGIPPMPTGRFFFPLGATEGQERSCIEPSRDSKAWSCNIEATLMLIDFSYNASTSVAGLTLHPAPAMPGTSGIFYGPQPPRIDEQRLMWVTDLRDPGRGPALHFQTAYDKVVIFEPNSFPSPGVPARQLAVDTTPSNVLDKRHDTMPADQGPHNHRFANSPGETPWYCFWNQTYIEGFIYIQQPVHGAETQQFTVSNMMMMMTSQALPTATSATFAASPPTPTSSPTHAPIFQSSSSPNQQLQPFATILPRDMPFISSPSPVFTSIPSIPTSPPSRFPFIVKIEERRLPNPAFTPFCQRMHVLPNGATVPLLNDNGNPIVEVLREAPTNKADAQVTAGVMTGQSGHSRKGSVGDSMSSNGRARRRRWEMPPSINEEWGVDWDGKARLIRRNQEPSNSCHCVWVSPYS